MSSTRASRCTVNATCNRLPQHLANIRLGVTVLSFSGGLPVYITIYFPLSLFPPPITHRKLVEQVDDLDSLHGSDAVVFMAWLAKLKCQEERRRMLMHWYHAAWRDCLNATDGLCSGEVKQFAHSRGIHYSCESSTFKLAGSLVGIIPVRCPQPIPRMIVMNGQSILSWGWSLSDNVVRMRYITCIWLI